MRLQDKRALVTGGARGIGQAIARKLAQEGADVAIADLLAEEGAATAKEIEALGRRGLFLRTDATVISEVDATVARAAERLGAIDILVNVIGWEKVQPFLETEEATWEKVIAINYKSVIYFCKAVLPRMIEHGSGRVVNISSDAARVGSSGEAVYSGAKGAVISFSKTLAREMARHNITVNAVCPGPTDTPLMRSNVGAGDQSTDASDKIIQAMIRNIPLRRIGQPADIAAAVAFLASDEAGFITGQTLSVSGGLTMA